MCRYRESSPILGGCWTVAGVRESGAPSVLLEDEEKGNRTVCREDSCDDPWCHLVLVIPAWASGKESTYVHILGALHDREDLICHGLDS